LRDEQRRHGQRLRSGSGFEFGEALVVDCQPQRVERRVPRQHRRVPLDDLVEPRQHGFDRRVAEPEAGGDRGAIPPVRRWEADELGGQ